MIIEGMFVSAMIASGAVPLLARLAARIGLVDIPDARKTHSGEKPLCGGIAIAIGMLVPLVLQEQLPFWMFGYLIGASILLCLGILDDWHELVFFWRLLGQFVAATTVLIFSAPFLSFSFGLDPTWDWLVYPASVVFIVAVTNAINFLDGLDGLAVGCVVLSLVAVIFVAFQNDAYWALVIATSLMGSLLGFLPYNSYPATVFMGDTGSTFIGFNLAVTALMAVGHGGDVANLLMPVLIVGLPLFDMVGVVLERMGSGRMPFHADRRHVHHKLLAMNVPHGRAVIILYVAQAVTVTAGVVFCHEMGPTVLLFAMFLFAMTVVPVRLALASGWQSAPVARSGVIERRNLWLRRGQWLPAFTIGVVQLAMTGVLLAGAFISADPSSWRLDLVAVVPAALLVLSRSALASWLDIPKVLIRMLISTTIASAGFITVQGCEGSALAHWMLIGYALFFVTAVALAIRLTRREIFQITSGDILAILAAGAACIIFSEVEATPYLGVFVALTLPQLYAAELLLARRSHFRRKSPVLYLFRSRRSSH